MKKIVLLVMVLGALSLLVGCGGSGGSSHKDDDISIDTLVTVVTPTAKYGDAIKLAYSGGKHLISVYTTLPKNLQNKVLIYKWTWDSLGGTVIQGTDDVYANAEFIYRPNDTTTIPPDVIVGQEREYNRGFKLSNENIGRYLYLSVKTSSGQTLDNIKFYVAEPQVPPAPNQ